METMMSCFVLFVIGMFLFELQETVLVYSTCLSLCIRFGPEKLSRVPNNFYTQISIIYSLRA